MTGILSGISYKKLLKILLLFIALLAIYNPLAFFLTIILVKVYSGFEYFHLVEKTYHPIGGALDKELILNECC